MSVAQEEAQVAKIESKPPQQNKTKKVNSSYLFARTSKNNFMACIPVAHLHPHDFFCSQTQEPEVQAPVQQKEGMKKAKADVKPVPFIITDDLKEPDEGLTLPAVRGASQFLMELCCRQTDPRPFDKLWCAFRQVHGRPKSATERRRRSSSGGKTKAPRNVAALVGLRHLPAPSGTETLVFTFQMSTYLAAKLPDKTQCQIK